MTPTRGFLLSDGFAAIFGLLANVHYYNDE
jgi:hypothetical protein